MEDQESGNWSDESTIKTVHRSDKVAADIFRDFVLQALRVATSERIIDGSTVGRPGSGSLDRRFGTKVCV